MPPVAHIELDDWRSGSLVVDSPPEFMASALAHLDERHGGARRLLHRHGVTDDRTFGGGPGMVMKIERLVAAIRWVREEDPGVRVVLLAPQGELFSQEKAQELARVEHLLLIAGHYEGMDDRVRHYVEEELSIGDYILTGGEPAALVWRTR